MDRLPLLPGFVFKDPTENQFHVCHTLNYKNGYAVPRQPRLGIGKQPLDADSVAFLDLDQWCWDPSLTYGEPRSAPRPSAQPKFAEFANQALAFQAFCVEAEQGPLDEQPRVRHVLVFFHLEDDSMSVVEPPVPNSGFVQGKVVRRHRIPKAGGEHSFWHWKDLNVGCDVLLYGRTYRLASCDHFTREFLSSQGVEVGAGTPLPPDPYTELQRAKAARLAHAQNEVERRRAQPGEQRLDKLGRFLVFDRQVLRFYAVWRDPGDPLAEQRHFRVHLFLADGSVEVRPEYRPNDGHDHYPTLISRQPLPREQQPVDLPSLSTARCYVAEDLRVGATMDVLGRALLLYDCDAFTRAFYRERLGISQPEAIDVSEPVPPPPLLEVPPHTGLGSPEDSLQSCLRLVPRAPRPPRGAPEDPERPLRYSLRLASERPGDLTRRFVLRFAPRLGHVTITELEGRNTGVLAGRFLGPTRLAKPAPEGPPLQPQYYGPADFAIGAVVHASGQRFVVTGADLYVLTFLERRAGLFSPQLLEGMRAHLRPSEAD